MTNKAICALVVDDEAMVNQLIQKQVTNLGYVISGAAFDGLEAVELTRQLRPDVVLMDLQMFNPETGQDDLRAGLEATRVIQEQCPTPVILLTAHESPELIQQASEAGVGAYLVKPARNGELERAIAIALARFKDMMALRQLNQELETEIAGRMQAEQSLRESNRHLEETLVELKATQKQVVRKERLAAVGQLAAGIAHEFNNILASISLYTAMSLRMSTLSPRIRERLQIIAEQTQHAGDLVQQMLDFGRRAMLKRESIDVMALLEETVSLLARTLPENIDVTLACEVSEFMIDADPERIQQAVVNLALNARDAMHEGGELCIGLERLRVEQGQRGPLPEIEAGEWVQVTVTDTGTGIPPDVLPHIYEPFFTTRAPMGSGLGLAQVYGIVNQHEGHIGVETRVSVDSPQSPGGGQSSGTTFTLYLPALPATEPQLKTPGWEAPGLDQGGGETVLVVEDSLPMRTALVDCLEMLNYRVLEAVNGHDALTVFEAHQGEIALVLSDWMMPGMGGLELARALNQRHQFTKVLMLTGHSLDQEVLDATPESVVGWVQKPPHLDQLAQKVAQAVRD